MGTPVGRLHGDTGGCLSSPNTSPICPPTPALQFPAPKLHVRYAGSLDWEKRAFSPMSMVAWNPRLGQVKPAPPCTCQACTETSRGRQQIGRGTSAGS